MRSLVWLPVAAMMMLVSCGTAGPTGSEGADSGLRGVVLLGPQCPVVTPEEPCPDVPAPGATVTVTKAGSEEVVATAKADDEGRYRVALPPGEYDVSADAGMLCKPASVTVTEGAFVAHDVACDTGIR